VVESRQTEAPVSREKDRCDSTLVRFSCFSCLNLFGFDAKFRTYSMASSQPYARMDCIPRPGTKNVASVLVTVELFYSAYTADYNNELTCSTTLPLRRRRPIHVCLVGQSSVPGNAEVWEISGVVVVILSLPHIITIELQYYSS
jgi:hypothetical protein